MIDLEMVSLSADAKLDVQTLQISDSLAGSWGLENKKSINLRVGQSVALVKLKFNSSRQNNIISISPVLLKKLCLASGRKYGVKASEDEIQLGPVVGIMIDLGDQEQKPFAGQTFFARQLLECGSRLGEVCFAFSPYAINWSSKTISGYSYGKNGWIKGVFPIPDVVYPRERAYSQGKIQIRKKLEKYGVMLLNPTLVGKWDTYKIVANNARLIRHIPDTRLVTDFTQIERMLKTYRNVYIKPVNGSQGKNIIRVSRRNNSSIYDYQFVVDKRVVKGTAVSLTQLHTALKRIMGSRRYIIQNQINLIKIDNGIVDVRILVQKDHTGEWGASGLACRVGRRGSITSNISSGGSGRKLNAVLEKNFVHEGQRQEILRTLEYVALESARTIEKAIGSAGEMGIDLGIDKEGRVWFIESNLRPARQVFTLIGETDTRLRTVERPMLYARYLAGF